MSGVQPLPSHVLWQHHVMQQGGGGKGGHELQQVRLSQQSPLPHCVSHLYVHSASAGGAGSTTAAIRSSALPPPFFQQKTLRCFFSYSCSVLFCTGDTAPRTIAQRGRARGRRSGLNTGCVSVTETTCRRRVEHDHVLETGASQRCSETCTASSVLHTR